MMRKLCLLLTMLLLCGSMAQADGAFNPSNPPDPQATYRLTVSHTPAGVANVSGKGTYKEGTRVYVNTSLSNVDYAFKHWLKDGEIYTTSKSFYYTMTKAHVEFVAVYEYVVFNPSSPSDPGASYKWRLFVNSEPPEAASFNINSGNKYEQGSTVTLRTYANQGFEFVGWYDEANSLLSTEKNFNFNMPSAITTLTARYVFNPGSPSDPAGGNQGNIDNTRPMGDVNGDGTVTVADVVSVVNHILGYPTDRFIFEAADADTDGQITVADVVAIVNIVLHVDSTDLTE